jgi:hypothetical protein
MPETLTRPRHSNRANHREWTVAKNFIDSDFIKVKYLFRPSESRQAELQRTYDRLIDRAKDRVYVRGVHDNHHILPKSLGGSNAKSNIAILTYDEHFLAHWLLTRLTVGNDRIIMLHALYKMSQGGKNNKNRHVAGWQYALARLAQSEAARGNNYNTGLIRTNEHKENISKGLLKYYSLPGALEAKKLAQNTEKALINIQKAAALRYTKPGALEAHIASHNTEKCVDKCRQAALRRFSQPTAKEAHKRLCNSEEHLRKVRKATREKVGQPVENVTLNLIFGSIAEAKEYFGFKQPSGISACCRGLKNTAGGYVWRYISKEDFTSRLKCAKTEVAE